MSEQRNLNSNLRIGGVSDCCTLAINGVDERHTSKLLQRLTLGFYVLVFSLEEAIQHSLYTAIY